MSDSPDVLSDVTAAAQSALPDADTAPPSVSPAIPLDPNATPAGAVLSGQSATPSVAAGGAPANTGVGSQVDPAAAPPATPHQSFLSKLLHAVGEAFAPSTKQTVDSQGNIVNTPLNSGQRAVGGIGRFLTAAGPALAQHGPGSFGKSIAAGEEAVNDQQEQQRKNLLDQAQNVRSTSKSAQDQLLTQASLAKSSQDIARNAIDMKAAQQGLDEHQVALANSLQEIQNIPGAKTVGHFDSNSDIASHLDTVGPQLAKQYAVDLSKNNIRLIPSPKGGFDAVSVPKGAGEMSIGEGKTLLTPVIDPKTNQLTLKPTPADPNMTWDKYQVWNSASSSAYNSAQKNQADIAKTKADTNEANAGAAEKESNARLNDLFAPAAKVAGGTAGTAPGQTAQIASPSGVPYSTDKTSPDYVDTQYVGSLPQGAQSMVMNVINGTVPAPPMTQRGKTNPLAMAVSRATNGQYDATKYNAYNTLRTKFTSGKDADTLNAYSTTLEHLKNLYDHSTFVSTGIAGGKVASALGSKDAQQKQVDLQLVSTELTKAVSNGNMTEGEMKGILGSLQSWTATGAHNKIQEAADLLHGKMDSFQQQLANARPNKYVNMPQLTTPQADAAYKYIKSGGAQAQPSAPPAGATHIVPNKDGIKHYTNAAGTVDLGVAP